MWSRMLPLGRPTDAFVRAVMAADPSGEGRRVSENDLYFALRNDVILASELDVQCKLLMHIMEPPPVRLKRSPRRHKGSFADKAGEGSSSASFFSMHGREESADFQIEDFLADGTHRGISRARGDQAAM